MDAAEALVAEVRPDQLYPMEFVVYRVTGFRPESGSFDATVVGQALVRDLGAFVQALSAELDLPADQPRGRAMALDEAAATLEVDRRTVQRHRGDGLVLHWVRDDQGRRFLGCYPDALDRYLEMSGGGMRRTRSWKRVSSSERQAILERARIMHEAEGGSLDATAVRIAAEMGRARSTIRQVLKQFDRTMDRPLFGEHGPLSSRDVALCDRARGMGIPLSRCAARFGKSTPALHRAMLRERVSRLQAIPLRWVELSTFDREDADEVLLGIPEVRTNLPGPNVLIDLAMIKMPTRLDNRERVVVAGHWLVARAGRALASLSHQPRVGEVDAIERDLLWAGRIRAALVNQGLLATLQACEHWLGRPAHALPREAALQLLVECLQAAWSVVEALEPRWSSRLESRCSAAMDRVLSTRRPVSRVRAAARHGPGDLQLAWPMRNLVAWPWLEPRPEWTTRIERLEPGSRQLVVDRWGLDGGCPAGIDDLAAAHGTTSNGMQRRLQAVEVRLRMNRP